MPSRSSHRGLVALLLVVATLATIGGCGALWVDRQMLDTGRWGQTSERLIDNRDVRASITGFLVRQAFADNGIDAALHEVLPAGLANTAQAQLQRSATTAGEALLATPAGRRAWTHASRQTQSQLLSALDSARGNQNVVLDLTPLLRDVVQELLGTAVARAIPGSSRVLAVQPGGGRLVVLRPDQVRSLRGDVSTVRTLAWALPAIAAAAFLLSLLLAAGRRRVTLSRIGYRLLFAGAIVLLARLVVRGPLADATVSSGTDRAAVRAAWMIATSQLRDVAEGVLVAGVVVVVVSWALRALGRSSPPRRASSAATRPPARAR